MFDYLSSCWNLRSYFIMHVRTLTKFCHYLQVSWKSIFAKIVSTWERDEVTAAQDIFLVEAPLRIYKKIKHICELIKVFSCTHLHIEYSQNFA